MVLPQLVVEVRIESRRVIWPSFRLPLAGFANCSIGVADYEYVVDPDAQHPNRTVEFEGAVVDLLKSS